jgi:predicted NACHT family NTPase
MVPLNLAKKAYNWKRFWCPRTGTFNLLDDGYLFDPDSERGHIYNPEVVSFETISGTPCLALLGEPGIGKTCALQAEREIISSKVKAESGEIIWIDLHSYGNENRLIEDLFRNPALFSCIKNTRSLHIFLDSLDECLLRIDNLAALLIDEFKKYPIENINLRIACRTADWPVSLENGLKELWAKDTVKVYELVPLRKKDVIEAAKVNGFDSDCFLNEIARMKIAPLAFKPVTLAFLINMYKRFGGFPSTQAELYLRGCELLCEETSESRRDSRRVG